MKAQLEGRRGGRWCAAVYVCLLLCCLVSRIGNTVDPGIGGEEGGGWPSRVGGTGGSRVRRLLLPLMGLVGWQEEEEAGRRGREGERGREVGDDAGRREDFY